MRIGSLSELLALKIPFSLGNPDPFRQAVDLQAILIGLSQPTIRPRITPTRRRSWGRVRCRTSS